MRDNKVNVSKDLLKRISYLMDNYIGTMHQEEDELRSLLAAAPKAECTNSDSWNCKYCNKTKDCEALKDLRNFAAPKAEQPPVQEPVAWLVSGGDGRPKTYEQYPEWAVGIAVLVISPLYAAPQPVSDAYRIAVDTGLVCAHLGVTNPEDDYETARKKLNDLICWSIQVDRDLGPADALVEALEVLAKLGNGEHYGNSDGNVIAQRALAAYRAAQEKK